MQHGSVAWTRSWPNAAGCTCCCSAVMEDLDKKDQTEALLSGGWHGSRGIRLLAAKV